MDVFELKNIKQKNSMIFDPLESTWKIIKHHLNQEIYWWIQFIRKARSFFRLKHFNWNCKTFSSAPHFSKCSLSIFNYKHFAHNFHNFPHFSAKNFSDFLYKVENCKCLKGKKNCVFNIRVDGNINILCFLMCFLAFMLMFSIIQWVRAAENK